MRLIDSIQIIQLYADKSKLDRTGQTRIDQVDQPKRIHLIQLSSFDSIRIRLSILIFLSNTYTNLISVPPVVYPKQCT